MADELQGKDEAGILAVSDDEVEQSHDMPAIYANRFVATWGPVGIRLAFAEQAKPDSPSHFRAAFALGYQDALSLYQILEKALKSAVESPPKGGTSQDNG